MTMESIPVLTSENSYSSPVVKVSLLAKLFPSLYVYINFLNIILPSARQGKHGFYPDAEYVRDSTEIMHSIERAGVHFEFENLHVIQSLKSPCVYVANHMSMLETFIFNVMVRPYQEMTFVVKDSLLKYPVFKYLLRDRNPIAVSRKNPREDLMTVLNEGVDRLNKGISVVVFPQTTRSLSVDPSTFNTIGIKLAQRGNVPVVPVALKTDVWGNGKLIKDLGKIDPSKKVHFYFGEPIRLNRHKKDIHEQIVSFIRSKLIQWQKDES